VGPALPLVLLLKKNEQLLQTTPLCRSVVAAKSFKSL